MTHVLEKGSAFKVGALPSDKLSDNFNDDELAQAYGYFWQNMDSALHGPPALNHLPQGALAPRVLPWNGKGGFTQQIPANTVVRMAPQPWCIDPIVMKFGIDGDSAFTNNENDAPTFTAYTAGPNPERSDPLALTKPYMGGTMAQSGFTASGLKIEPVAQFMGGYLEVEIAAAEGATASIVAIGSDETREIGRTAFTQRSSLMAELGIGGLHDYQHHTDAALLGRLGNLKAPSQLVGSSCTQRHFVAIPIPPTRMTPYAISLPGVNSEFLATHSNFISSTATPGNDGDAITTENYSTGYGFNMPASTFAGPNAELAALYPRVRRATSSIGQTLLDGMPQLEITASGQAVDLVVRFKMFYHVQVGPSHPNYTMSLRPAAMPSRLTHYLHHLGGTAGTGPSKQEAIMAAKVNTDWDHHTKPVTQALSAIPETGALIPHPGTHVVQHQSHKSVWENMFAGVKNVGSWIGGQAVEHGPQILEGLGSVISMLPGPRAKMIGGGMSIAGHFLEKDDDRKRPRTDRSDGFQESLDNTRKLQEDSRKLQASFYPSPMGPGNLTGVIRPPPLQIMPPMMRGDPPISRPTGQTWEVVD